MGLEVGVHHELVLTYEVAFVSIQHLMCLRIRFGEFSFTVGAMIIGLFVISCSVALLKYLFHNT